MFRELFDTAPDAMIVVDLDGKIIRANEQAERLFGFAEKELIGRSIEMLMPERARSTHHSHVLAYVRNPRVRPMGTGQELVGQTRDGRQFPVEIALSPLKTPDGQLFLASVRDVSETLRARQALNRARYDGFIAQISQLVLAASDLDNAIGAIPELVARAAGVSGVAIVFKQAQFNKMHVRAAFGVDHDLLDRLPWNKFAASSHQAANIAGAMEYAAPMTLGSSEISGFAKAIVFPLSGGDDMIGGLVALAREQRDFDRDAINFLQSVSSLLTSAVQRLRSEEQLSHAQRLEAIGQLTGGIAHDFNNLLTIVSGNLQILEDELADRPAAREIIGTALRAVGRGADLTRKLLAFARKQRLLPVAVDPKALLGELGGMLGRTLGETIQLEISCAPDLANVFADESQLDAALVNLALNARDAMPRGGRLEITARHACIAAADPTAEAKAGDYIVFSVRDTGTGMTPDVMARAFEPFFTTKDVGKGSGLGLSMVYGFVKQSSGHLTVESQLGYGTCIRLHLPVAGSLVPVNEAVLREGARANEMVLVVEDEADVRDIAVRFLQTLGYKTLSAADAESALQILAENERIGLLFSDVVLGTGMSGPELAAEAQRRRPALRVLLASGYEDTGSENGALAGRFALLQKPYRREALGRAIRQSLDGDPTKS
ncbi:MAG: PAS domain S-box protein [Rudaea sp.]